MMNHLRGMVPIAEGRAVAQSMLDSGETVATIAKKAGIPLSAVQNTLDPNSTGSIHSSVLTRLKEAQVEESATVDRVSTERCRERIQELSASGFTIHSIAAACGVSYTTIYRLRAGSLSGVKPQTEESILGVDEDHPHLKNRESTPVEAIRDMALDGATWDAVEDAFGRSRNSLQTSLYRRDKDDLVVAISWNTRLAKLLSEKPY